MLHQSKFGTHLFKLSFGLIFSMVFVACECGDLKGGGGKPSNKKNPQAPPESPASQPSQVPPPPPPDPKQQEQAFLDEVLRKIEAGEPVDFTQASVNGLSALHIAVQHANDPAIIQKLVDSGAAVDALDSAGDTPLHHALKAGKWEMAKALVDKNLIGKKANVNALDGEGNRPLYMVLKKDLKQADNLAMADFLVKNGADIDAADRVGRTLLSLVICEDNLAAAEFLVENKAKINLSDSLGFTPAFAAVQHASLEMLQFLKSQGADLYTQDNYERNLLHWAAWSDEVNKVKWLLAEKVDLHVANKAGNTSLHEQCIALSRVMELPRHSGPISVTNINDFLLTSFDIIQLLIERGANVDSSNKEGITPLAALKEASNHIQAGPARQRLEEIIRLAESKSTKPST